MTQEQRTVLFRMCLTVEDKTQSLRNSLQPKKGKSEIEHDRIIQTSVDSLTSVIDDVRELCNSFIKEQDKGFYGQNTSKEPHS